MYNEERRRNSQSRSVVEQELEMEPYDERGRGDGNGAAPDGAEQYIHRISEPPPYGAQPEPGVAMGILVDPNQLEYGDYPAEQGEAQRESFDNNNYVQPENNFDNNYVHQDWGGGGGENQDVHGRGGNNVVIAPGSPSQQHRSQQHSSRRSQRSPSGNRQPEPQERPHQVRRMGTVRDNVDDEPQSTGHKPYFVGFVVVLCAIMFVFEMSRAHWKIQPFRDNPMLGPSSQALLQSGAKEATLILNGQWYRLIAPIFLHAGIIHLLMNLSVMMGLGRDLESAYGSVKVAIIFFASGIFGILMSCLFIPDVIGVGASGALFGWVGAMFGDFLHNYEHIQEGRAKYFFQLVLSAVIGLAVGLVPFIDNYAHVGGFVSGLILSVPVLRPSSPKPRDGEGEGEGGVPVPRRNAFLVVICTVLILGGYVVAFTLFYGGTNAENCLNCKYINCIPTPWWTC